MSLGGPLGTALSKRGCDHVTLVVTLSSTNSPVPPADFTVTGRSDLGLGEPWRVDTGDRAQGPLPSDFAVKTGSERSLEHHMKHTTKFPQKAGMEWGVV